MGIISNLENRSRNFSDGHRPIVIRAGYSGAKIGRLTADMVVNPLSADTDIRWSLKILRARCRDLAINSDYVRKFLWMVASNVVGPKGIIFQSKIKNKIGELDKESNKVIEEAFKEWGKKKNCTVTGLQSWSSFQRQVIQTVARDGEIFIRKIIGFPNDFGFALQALESDYVDENYNDREKNIRMGIEYDGWRKPIAYHFLQSNIVDYQVKTYSRTYTRVPASEVIHLYIQDRPEQGRGVPWIHTALTRLGNLDGYEESELVASRTGAGKMGFYESETGEEYTGDAKDEKENPIQEVEPGTFETLPAGMKFKAYDPQHPTTAYPNFVKSCLRGISAGLLVSYNGLANDLEGVNYSSIRQGVIDERDIWRTLQAWFIENLCDEVYESWKPMASLSVKVKGFTVIQPNSVKWQPRGWAWVDPEKDQNANILGIGAGLNTRTKAVAEEGLDLEDIFDELAEEERMAKEKGLNLTLQSKVPGQPVALFSNEDLAEWKRKSQEIWNRRRGSNAISE